MQEGFFFGPGEHRIFANYHPAAGAGGRVLTVVCPPLFSDYMRTHLALRELAISLAQRGQHVLRFDYRGTGDSFGELGEVTVADWLADIALAVREGLEISGSSMVRLVGARAGALLACAATRALSDVQRLVLWDPISTGADYLKLLRRVQAIIVRRNDYLSRAERREASHEYAGYQLSQRMVDEFRLLDASAYSSVPKSKLHVIRSSSGTDFPVPGASQELVAVDCKWDTAASELILTRPVLERLVACLTKS